MSVLLSIGIDITLIAGLLGLLILIPIVSAASRRLHDTGHSGWLQILPIFLLLLAIVGYELRTENINSIWSNLMIIIGGMGAVTMFGLVIVRLATPGTAG
ncbi:MAG: DUF805 domain-containing protein [Robiginitomaculum sp.]|nr:DUF805 domain-containing protein [Robiginitomaculum sp.]